MKKIGKLVSVYEFDSSSFGKIHRGYKFEKELKDRIIFYEMVFSLRIPEENPQHIAAIDIIYKEQGKDFTNIAHPYISGFPLSLILKKCQRENFPLPLDQSLLIIERIASVFDLFKFGFPHPFFIWLTFDGEVKCSPIPLPRIFQKLKPEDIQNYLSPQILQGDDWGRSDQVYSAGVLFFELLTGKPLPPAKNEDEVIQAVVGSHLLTEGNIPKDLQVILLKSLSFKSSERFQHIKNLREELGKLIYSGAYSPTTFNLAFFMHSLFREEIEKEEKILKEEDAMDFTEILKPPKIEAPVKPPEKTQIPEILEVKKKKIPFIFIGVSIFAIFLIIFSIFIFKGKKQEPIQMPVQNQEDEKLKKEIEEYKKKMEELEKQALIQKEELERLQKEAQKNPDAKKELEKKKEEQKKTEEKLKEMEERKKEIEKQKVPEIPPTKEETIVSKPIEEPKKEEILPQKEQVGQKKEKIEKELPIEEIKKIEETPPKQEIQKSSVKEGDLIALEELDTVPVVVKRVNPEYPPIAKKQKKPGKVMLKVLVNQNGEPEEIQVVSVTPHGKYGFEKSAVDAVKKYKFQPGTKEGVKIKCWFWVPVVFNP